MGARDDPGELTIAGQDRAEYGYLVTIVHVGRYPEAERVLHVFGPSREAMRQVVEEIERLDGEWKVRTISSPASIYRDLQGARGVRRRLRSRQTMHGNPRSHLRFNPFEVEYWLLSQIGRLDLLERHPDRVRLDPHGETYAKAPRTVKAR